MNSKSNERQNFGRLNIQSQRKKSPFITIYGGRKQDKASNTNSYKKILAIEVSRTPTQTSFQRKIKQAIELRYLKSKNKNYKYEVIKDNAISRSHYNLESQYDDFEQRSQASQQMEQMKIFAYLKTQKFVNIHEFHSMIKVSEQKSNDLRDNLRKRKLRTNTCRSIQNQRFFSKGLQKQSRSVSPLNQNIKREVFNGQRIKKENNLSQNIFKAEQILKPPNQKKKSLTARETHKNQGEIRQQHFLTINSSKPNTKHYLKDTFQLKNASKLLITNTKGSAEVKQFATVTPKEQTSQKTYKRKNQGRRYLMQKNQEKILTHKTIIPEQIQQVRHEKMKKMSIRNTKILSLKKIQTQKPPEPRESTKNSKLIFEHNSQYQSQTSKNNKRQLLQNYSSNVLIGQNQDTEMLTPSMSQQKWKLQEISFKFKPIESKDKCIEDKRQKSIQLGLSLEKAYEKLLSERKIQQKQRNYFHKRETVNPKNQGKIMPTGILSTDETHNQNRSISKNKRRKLRLQTEYESRQYEKKKYQLNQKKEHDINLSSRSKEGLFVESEKNCEEARIFPRSNIKRTLKKREKIERFSTIS